MGTYRLSAREWDNPTLVDGRWISIRPERGAEFTVFEFPTIAIRLDGYSQFALDVRRRLG